MSRQNRLKASDLLRGANPIFAQKVSFAAAFPEIDKVQAIVLDSPDIEETDFEHPHAGVRRCVFGETNPGEFVDCQNRFCFGGGFSIGSILRAMVNRRETIREGHEICRGYEGSPKGRRRYRSCLHTFSYRITIQYKQMEQPII